MFAAFPQTKNLEDAMSATSDKIKIAYADPGDKEKVSPYDNPGLNFKPVETNLEKNEDTAIFNKEGNIVQPKLTNPAIKTFTLVMDSIKKALAKNGLAKGFYHTGDILEAEKAFDKANGNGWFKRALRGIVNSVKYDTRSFVTTSDKRTVSPNAHKAEMTGSFAEKVFKSKYGVDDADFKKLVDLGLIVKGASHHNIEYSRELGKDTVPYVPYYHWADSHAHNLFSDVEYDENGKAYGDNAFGDAYRNNKEAIHAALNESPNRGWRDQAYRNIEPLEKFISDRTEDAKLTQQEIVQRSNELKEANKNFSGKNLTDKVRKINSKWNKVIDDRQAELDEKARAKWEPEYYKKYKDQIAQNDRLREQNKAIPDSKENLLREVAQHFGIISDKDIDSFVENAHQNAVNNSVRYLRDNKGDVYGFTDPHGNIFVDTRHLRMDTPFHEYTHLWNAMVKEHNPELWNKIVELVTDPKNQAEIKQLINTNYDEFSKGIEDKNHPYNSLVKADAEQTKHNIVDELFSRLTGKEGQDKWSEMMADASQKDKNVGTFLGKLKDYINQFWSWIGDKLGIRDLDEEEISKLTLSSLFTQSNKG